MRALLALPFTCLLACSSSSAPSGGTPTGAPDASVGSTCPPLTGTGTKHTSPTADETWTAAGSPHAIDANLSIPAGKTVTLEPCAVVRLKSAVGILVEGRLVALGAADKPIRVEREPSAAAWTSIEARKGAEIRLAHATIEGGGSANGSDPATVGAIDIRGDQELAPQPILFVDQVAVKGSESLGILLREGGGFATGSKDLQVSGGKSFPVASWGRAAGSIPTGNYTGNTVDEILLPAMGGRDDIKEDSTLANRGVPYRVGGPSLVVAKGALLTIPSGVALRFAKASRFAVDGAVRIDGTAAQPVLLTSAEPTPAAGDWVGLVFEETPDPRNAITNAKISFAGGASQISSYGCPSPGAASFANEGAIVIAGNQPASAFVTSTTIEASGGDGIVRGWTGDAIDFLPTNTFTSIARCQQTFPKPPASVCPDPAPCPK